MAIPVKLTRAHQVTLPKRLLERAGWLRQEYFIADLQGGALILKPITITARPPLASLVELRRHFAALGVTKRDVADAVAWTRRKTRRSPPRYRSAR